MTPKLSDSDDERKALLSWILKLWWPGICLMTKSTQMIEAPTMQAVKLLAKVTGMSMARITHLCR
jgi:hypothetical protein